MIRLFIGINLEKQIKEPLSKIQAQVDFTKASWVAPKNIHLTLKFLGWTREDSIGQIKNAIKSITNKYKPFEMTVNGLGAFPTSKKARVLWVGLNGDVSYLVQLQEEIENVLIPFGFKKEKRHYHPHITLARLRIIEDATKATEIEIPQRKMTVREIALFQSKLTPKGAVYSIIENFPLKA